MEVKYNKLFITEIINDLHKHGFVRGGKAETMLYEWSAELRDNPEKGFPSSKTKRIFYKEIGKHLW